jgi:hypothetical protein
MTKPIRFSPTQPSNRPRITFLVASVRNKIGQ